MAYCSDARQSSSREELINDIVLGRAYSQRYNSSVFEILAKMTKIQAIISAFVTVAVGGFGVYYALNGLGLDVNRPSAAEPVVSVSLGQEQIIWDYTTQHCDTLNHADGPVHAYRDNLGTVRMPFAQAGALSGVNTGSGNYNLVGSSLDALQRDCNVIYRSANDQNFNNFKYHEWLYGTYTEDGTNVYALAHDEWYCDLPNTNYASGGTRAITLAKSTDGGRTFSHPADYKVLVPAEPYTYTCDAAHNYVYGYLQPSNIVKKDGYYYAFTGFITPPDTNGHQSGGQCLLRTNNLDSASSWTVWTDHGWDTSLTGPCTNINSLSPMNVDSVTYNTYLGKYMATGNVFNVLPPGIYFSTSTDLMNWSSPQPIVTAPDIPTMLSQYHYGSIIDPSDTTKNFGQSDQNVYLYYLRDNAPGTATIDRDLIRRTLRFNIQGTPTPTPSQTATPTTTPSSSALSCAPGSQLVSVNQPATVRAFGGLPTTYIWSAPAGRPSIGRGSLFTVRYDTAGDKRITVRSGRAEASCIVRVVPQVSATPTPTTAITPTPSPTGTPTPTVTPKPDCQPRPVCLDAKPFPCDIPEPEIGWCPAPN